MRTKETQLRVLLRRYFSLFVIAFSLEAIYTLARLYIGYLSEAKTALPLGQLFSDGVVVLAVSRFAMTVLALYLCLGLVAAWAHGKALQNLSDNRRRLVAMLFVIALMATMHWWNALLHPYSILSAHYIFPSPMAWPALLGAVAAQCVVAAILLLALGKTVAAHPRLAGAVPMVIGAAIMAAASVGQTPTEGAARPDKPNIILIGIDSLRADVLDASSNIAMPRLREFISESVRFDNAFTPLARTFPAWVSILTGESPEQHGAIFNLMSPDAVASDRSLAHELRAHGYHTVLATDERRFSNIDESYGFDQIIGPRMGVADFLLGTANDFALSNLVLETPIGRYLFPYNYGNRAAATTYHPDQFENLLSDGLEHPIKQPIFLAAHFCLPHWPYHWSRPPAGEPGPDESRARFQYRATLEAADKQVGHLLDQLRDTGALDNAIVILLSDHGESFAGEHASNPIFDGSATRTANQRLTTGHGTHVLSQAQYHVALGMRRFGGHPFGTGRVEAPVSLLDIKPTLLSLLGLPGDSQTQGHSLSRLLQDSSVSPGWHDRFITWETGFTPTNVQALRGQLADLVAESMYLYNLSPPGRLTIKPEVLMQLTADKQFAVFHDGVVVAAIPSGDQAMELQWTAFGNTPKMTIQSSAWNASVDHLCSVLARRSTRHPPPECANLPRDIPRQVSNDANHLAGAN